MIRCKNCKEEIVLMVESGLWKHLDTMIYKCKNKEKVAEPEMFCKSCGEPKYDSDVCGCGYGYEIREI
jgi:hypothetical protein